MQATRATVIALFVIALSVSVVHTFDYDCCCDSFILLAPNSVTIECLYQHDYFDTQWTEYYNGYASAVDVCAFDAPYGTACGGCACEDIYLEFWTDVYGISKNSDAFAFGCGNTVTITRTFCYSCVNPNDRCATQSIYVVDTIAPELFVPPARTVECVSNDNIPGPDYDPFELDNWFGSVRATDLCTNPQITESFPVTINSSPCWTTLRRDFTATDDCNISTGSQTVTFLDSTAPVMLSGTGSYFTYTCDQTTSFASSNTANRPFYVDQCDNFPAGIPTSSDVVYPGKCAGDYTIERTWTATDDCLNTASFVQIIVVEDPDPPIVTTVAPYPLAGYVLAGNDVYTTVTCTVPAADNYFVTDGCGEGYLYFEETVTGHSEFQSRYDVIRNYKAVDDCGNAVEWVVVYNVVLDSIVTLSGPSEVTGAVKGSNIALTFSLSGTLCKEGFIAFDIGPAQFVSSTYSTCTGTNGGLVYCNVLTNASGVITPSGNFVLTITVPTTYAPDTLQIRYSFIGSDPSSNTINNSNDYTIIIFN